MRKFFYLLLFFAFIGEVNAQTYCTPTMSSVANYQIGIQNFTMGSINNSSGCPTNVSVYSNYTSLSTSIVSGSTLNFSVTLGSSNSTTVAFYIDWNKDGTFNTTGSEFIWYNTNTTASSVQTGSFVVPAVSPGNYRIRLASDFGGLGTIPGPCSGTYSGEFEDYTLTVFTPAPYDLTPIAFVSPTAGDLCGGSSVPINVRILNAGSNSMTGFNLTVTLSGAATGTYTRTGFARTINPAGTDTVQFPGINLNAVFGSVTFTAIVKHASDGYASDDTLRSTISFVGPASTPAFTSNPYNICGTGTVKLSTTAAANNTTLWYSGPATTPILSIGDTFTTPVLTGNTSYYASKVKMGPQLNYPNQGQYTYYSQNYNSAWDLVSTSAGAIIIDSITFQIAGYYSTSNLNLKLYYKMGTRTGFLGTPSAWTVAKQMTGFSIPTTLSYVTVPTGGIIVPPGATIGFFLYIPSDAAYLTNSASASGPDFNLTGGDIVNGELTGLYTTYYMPSTKHYYRKVCESSRSLVTVNFNPKPYGGDVVANTKFQGMNNGGVNYAPDIVGSNDTVSYKLNPPTGFTNANFGSAWTISGMSFTTSGGIAPGTSDTMTTLPNGSNPGTLQFVPSEAYEDSTMILRLTLYNMTTGCDSLITKYIYVAPKPKADFNASSFCFGSTTKFKDSTYIKAGIVNYLWNFGDGSNPVTSTDQYPTFVYSAPGTYTVTLTTTTALGYSSTKQKTITINYTPVSDFAYTNVCYGSTTNFSNTSTVGGGGSMSYVWDLGNSNSSISTNPTATYGSSGNYTVKLTSTSNGCSSSVSKTVYVFPVPDADFSGGLACSGLNIPFTNGSSIASGNLGYKWNFGDGSSIETEPQPSHQYDNSGTYTVRLVAYSEFGCIDSVSKTITVSAKPVAGFTAPGVCAGSDVTFSNTSSVSGSTITSTSWNFGDGNTGTNSGSSFLHNYATAGIYTAWLTITTAQGCKDSIMKTVQIGNIPVANFTTTGSVCVGGSVNFSDQSTGGSSMTYLWDFGSGNTSTAANPSYSYSSTGSKTVSLQVSTAANCSHTVNKTITVNGLPDAGFTVTRSNKDMREVTCVPNDKTLSSYRWDMGDGQVFNQVSPVYRYLSNGPFKITLTTTNNSGCQDSKQDSTTAAFNVSAGKLTTMGTTWNVYPNPFVNKSVVTLDLTKQSNVVIKITDVTGKLVSILANENFVPGNYTFDLEKNQELTKGIYWVLFEQDGMISVKSVVKY